MADSSDVTDALVALISGILYPNGLAGPIPAEAVKIYGGWPDPQTLDADLATAGEYGPRALHVTVFPRPAERNTTRYPAQWSAATINAATYTLSGEGQTITVGGSAPTTWYPQNLAIFLNGEPYVHQATAGQTASQVAEALLALAVVDFPAAERSGAVLTLPESVRIGALRVGTTGTARKEVRRQEKQFGVHLWADTHENRSWLVNAIDPPLADTPWLTLADGSKARMIYRSSVEIDTNQKQGIYRRDLFFTVEYATSRTDTFTEITAVTANLRNSEGDLLHSSTQ